MTRRRLRWDWVVVIAGAGICWAVGWFGHGWIMLVVPAMYALGRWDGLFGAKYRDGGVTHD